MNIFLRLCLLCNIRLVTLLFFKQNENIIQKMHFYLKCSFPNFIAVQLIGYFLGNRFMVHASVYHCRYCKEIVCLPGKSNSSFSWSFWANPPYLIGIFMTSPWFFCDKRDTIKHRSIYTILCFLHNFLVCFRL